MTLILHSHDKIEWLSLRCSCLNVWFSSHIRYTNTTLNSTKQFGIFNPDQSSFSVAWYQNEILCQNGNFMWPGSRNELIVEWPVGGWNIVSVSCKQIIVEKYKEMEWIHYRMKVTLVPCEEPLSLLTSQNIDVMLMLIKVVTNDLILWQGKKKCMSPRQDFMWCMF